MGQVYFNHFWSRLTLGGSEGPRVVLGGLATMKCNAMGHNNLKYYVGGFK